MKSIFIKFLSLLLVIGLSIINLPVTSFAEEKLSIPNYGTLSGHTGWINTLAISKDGKYIATGEQENVVKIWDVQKLKEISSFSVDQSVDKVEFSPNGKYLAVATGYKPVIVWDIFNNKKILELDDYSSYKRTLTFSPDSKTLITADNTGTATFWDIPSGIKLNTITFQDRIISIKYHPSKNILAIALSNNTIAIRNALTGEYIQTLYSNEEINQINFSPDGKFLTVAAGNQPTLFNVEQNFSQIPLGKETFKIPSNIDQVNLSPDGKFLFLEDRYHFYIFDFIKQSLIYTSESTYILDFGIDPNFKYLAIAEHQNINLYDLKDLSKQLTSISIEVEGNSLFLNEEKPIQLVAHYSNNTTQIVPPEQIKWQTSDFNILLANNGNIIPRGIGTATLSATYGGLTTSLPFEVVEPLKELSGLHFKQISYSLKEKGQQPIILIAEYTDGTEDQIPIDQTDLKVDDTNIALLYGNMLIARKPGKTSMKVHYKDFEATADVVIMDTTPPLPPVVDSLKSNGKILTGKAEVGATIVAKIGSKTYKTIVKSNGTYSLPIPQQKPGIVVTVQAIDKAGNKSKEVTIIVKK
ncbi:hypothetical protein J5Y03_08080 [Bacillus sp. RG28]|uniref:Bacterial Ig domain-containing protein n=1 Tax=Gottfriedia endophytica TaxID=2820819 RepID=A0A940SIM9_9BACI|nr:Ig-like domain-containing protein [Gottfriedia endophytica]MBP0725150.1 hypothetical protein [Gottfriedia endophytica]